MSRRPPTPTGGSPYREAAPRPPAEEETEAREPEALTVAEGAPRATLAMRWGRLSRFQKTLVVSLSTSLLALALGGVHAGLAFAGFWALTGTLWVGTSMPSAPERPARRRGRRRSDRRR